MAFNKLTNDEAERLALLAEECGEVVQAVGKILRHGYESQNPDDDSHSSNRDDLGKEIGDTLCVIQIIMDAGDVDAGAVSRSHDRKRGRLNQYLHEQTV